jgi:hydroxylamine reductase
MTPGTPTIALLEAVVKSIRLGPTLPAFVTPAVPQILVDNYDIKTDRDRRGGPE